MEKTEEQLTAIAKATDTKDNFAIIARAGAAKTTTLVMIAEALPDTDILCLAFNKKVAEEMTARLPKNCEAKTLHSLGMRAWQQFIRRSVEVSTKKNYDNLTNIISHLDQEEAKEAYENISETLDLISQAKNAGYLPSRHKGHWRPFMDEAVFYASLPIEPTALQIELVDAALIRSFQQALEGTIDFNDMIYCPALCSVEWPEPELTLVDEAQDLSVLNHFILKKLVKNRRIIAVGDPLQAIYGFRGADTQSMQNLQEIFKMDAVYLTMTFRCAKSIVQAAQWRAPDLRCPDTAPEGVVEIRDIWEPSEIQDGDAIICRNNAPLFYMAIKMLIAGLTPEIQGRDLLKPLTKIMNKLGKANTTTDVALINLDTWKEEMLLKCRPGAENKVYDQAACIRAIFEQTETVRDAKGYLESLLQRPGRIKLMTGHKAKGMEYNRVWFLDPDLCKERYEQDMNLKYVIETRAKTHLAYVTSKGFNTYAHI
jgi:superfamily I DNA/RNA helicase